MISLATSGELKLIDYLLCWQRAARFGYYDQFGNFRGAETDAETISQLSKRIHVIRCMISGTIPRECFAIPCVEMKLIWLDKFQIQMMSERVLNPAR
jgi:hypothetical protein